MFILGYQSRAVLMQETGSCPMLFSKQYKLSGKHSKKVYEVKIKKKKLHPLIGTHCCILSDLF